MELRTERLVLRPVTEVVGVAPLTVERLSAMFDTVATRWASERAVIHKDRVADGFQICAAQWFAVAAVAAERPAMLYSIRRLGRGR